MRNHHSNGIAACAAIAGVSLGLCSCGTQFGARREPISNVARLTFMQASFGTGPVVFTDDGGHLIEERRYEPFGAPVDAHSHSDTGDVIGAPDLVARDLNPLGKRTDVATAWSDHGARWMAPETGRWVTTDPPVAPPVAGFMNAPWALHPYQYVNQNPVAFWDPDGREPSMSDRTWTLVGIMLNVPEGVARDAALSLWRSSSTPVNYNAARNLATGAIHVGYIEDLASPADENAQLAQRHLSRAQARIYMNPETHEQFLAPATKAGTLDGNWIFGRRSAPFAGWIDLIPHEQLHYWNNDNNWLDNSPQRYEGEFRAYFVLDTEPNLDVRAVSVKQHILSAYPSLGLRYQNDPAFQAQVDAYTRPDPRCNLDNHDPNDGGK